MLKMNSKTFSPRLLTTKLFSLAKLSPTVILATAKVLPFDSHKNAFTTRNSLGKLHFALLFYHFAIAQFLLSRSFGKSQHFVRLLTSFLFPLQTILFILIRTEWIQQGRLLRLLHCLFPLLSCGETRDIFLLVWFL